MRGVHCIFAVIAFVVFPMTKAWGEGDVMDRDFRVTKTGVAIDGTVFPALDPTSARLINSLYVADANAVYWIDLGRKAFEKTRLSPVDGADPKSFTGIDPKQPEWVKDRSRVYYYGSVLEGANPESFKILKNGYSTDQVRVFHQSEKTPLDGKTVQIFSAYYQKDSKIVVRGGTQVVHGADAPSFRELYASLTSCFAVDRSSVFFEKEVIADADARTFRVVGEDGFGQDAHHVFFRNKVVTSANVETFQNLGEQYARDSKRIYFSDQLIEGADLGTFKVVGYGYSKDLMNSSFIAEDASWLYLDGVRYPKIRWYQFWRGYDLNWLIRKSSG